MSSKEGKALRILSKECVYVYRYLHAIPRVAKRGRQNPNTEIKNADERHAGAENQSMTIPLEIENGATESSIPLVGAWPQKWDKVF